MISFSITPKLIALCFLLILNTSADDPDLIDDPLLAQKAAVDFSPSLSDDAFGWVGNPQVIENEASLQQISDWLLEDPKSLLLTDSESVSCAGSPHTHKMSRRSWRQLSPRQQHDFCSVQDYEKPRLTPPSKPGADDIPAGQQDKAVTGRPRGSIGGPNEFLPDPMLNLKDSQLYGKPNPALCPNLVQRVPLCTPYDQKLTSPASVLVPSRFWKPDDWCSDMEGDWEDLWCCAFAYVHRSIGWELNVVFTRYPSTGIKCMLVRNHYTDN